MREVIDHAILPYMRKNFYWFICYVFKNIIDYYTTTQLIDNT